MQASKPAGGSSGKAKRDGRHRKPAGGRKAPKPIAAAARTGGLSRDRIAAAALELIDREGLDALSFRRLGEALGCEAMSLYHYFPNKAHLIDALVDQVFGALEVPSGAPGAGRAAWIERVRVAARNYRAMALGHPRFYPLLAVHRLNTRAGVRKLDQVMALFRDGGFDDATAARLFRAVGFYITGAALDETAGYAKGPSAAAPVSDAEIGRDCPNLAAAAPFFKQQHFAANFEQGLDLLLDAIARLPADPKPGCG